MHPKFDWDPPKAAANKSKHGVSFETASLVFADPFALIELDRIEGGEYRYVATGRVNWATVVVVAHTYPGDADVIRIISARRALPHERRDYEQHYRSQQF